MNINGIRRIRICGGVSRIFTVIRVCVVIKREDNSILWSVSMLDRHGDCGCFQFNLLYLRRQSLNILKSLIVFFLIILLRAFSTSTVSTSDRVCFMGNKAV